MKKVLFLITKSNWGGAQRYVYDLATNLDKSQFEPIVAMGGNGVLADMLKNAGIQTITLNKMKNTTSVLTAWHAGVELWSIVRSERPDIFHLNSTIAGLVGSIIGRIARVPRVIFTAHGWAFNEDRPYWQRLLIKSLHYLTVLLAHKTIAVSNAIVTQMNWPGAESKMKVINPGRTIGPMYSRSEAREKIVDFHSPLASYSNDEWLVCIAELHPIKRHTILIESMSQLIKTRPTVRLICIGDGQERKILEEKISIHNLNDHVFLTGPITEAARFLKAFDIFVLASKSESYGYVLHEAGLAGVPVIATNVGGIRDIITDQVSGLLLAPDSVEQLITSLQTLLINTELQHTLSDNLYKNLSGRTVLKMTTQTAYLYDSQ